jgi:hypothetical protein
MPRKSGNRFFALKACSENRSEGEHDFATGKAISQPSRPHLALVAPDRPDAAETAWLAGCLPRWRDRDFPRIHMSELELLGARDDLALDSEVAERLPLG